MSGPRVFIHDMTCEGCHEVFSVLGSAGNDPQSRCLCGNCMDRLSNVLTDAGLLQPWDRPDSVSDPRD
jgi:hypothetical protein